MNNSQNPKEKNNKVNVTLQEEYIWHSSFPYLPSRQSAHLPSLPALISLPSNHSSYLKKNNLLHLSIHQGGGGGEVLPLILYNHPCSQGQILEKKVKRSSWSSCQYRIVLSMRTQWFLWSPSVMGQSAFGQRSRVKTWVKSSLPPIPWWNPSPVSQPWCHTVQ